MAGRTDSPGPVQHDARSRPRTCFLVELNPPVMPDGHVNDVADAVGELVYLGRGVVAQCRALAAPQYGCPLPRGPRRLAGKGRVDTAIEGLPPSAPQPRPDEARSQPGRLGLPARDH